MPAHRWNPSTPCAWRAVVCAVLVLTTLSGAAFLSGCGSSLSQNNSNPNQTATTVAVSAAPTTVTSSSGSTNITVTVTNSTGGFAAPSGTVTLTGGNNINITTKLTQGTGDSSTASATVPGTTLNSGLNTITAAYGGDTYHLSSSGSVMVTLGGSSGGGINTRSTVTANPATLSATTDTSTFTASVLAGTGSTAPTGTVYFYDSTSSSSNVVIASAPLTAGSNATSSAAVLITGNLLQSGDNCITAAYTDPSGTFNASTSTGFNVVLNTNGGTGTGGGTCSGGGGSGGTVASTTTIMASPQSFAFGSSTNLTITVTGNSSDGKVAPSAPVNLFANGVAFGSATPSGYDGSSTATYTIYAQQGTALGASGTYAITGTFTGDSTYASSMSAPVTVTVTGTAKALTSLNLSISGQSTIPLGSCATVIGVVVSTNGAKPNDQDPTGTVGLTQAGTSTSLGSGMVADSSSGPAASIQVCTGTGQPINAKGTYTILGVYGGDSNYNASPQAATTLVVD